jgi:hypothetical protein
MEEGGRYQCLTRQIQNPRVPQGQKRAKKTSAGNNQAKLPSQADVQPKPRVRGDKPNTRAKKERRDREGRLEDRGGEEESERGVEEERRTDGQRVAEIGVADAAPPRKCLSHRMSRVVTFSTKRGNQDRSPLSA